jgi:hypothetical protein
MLRHRPITVRITATTSVSAILAAAYKPQAGQTHHLGDGIAAR